MYRPPTNSYAVCLAAMLIAVGCNKESNRGQSPSPLEIEQPDGFKGNSNAAFQNVDEVFDANTPPPITVDLPNRIRPVTVGMFCQKLSENEGECVWKVWVKVLIAPGHYLYAPTTAEIPFRTVSAELPLRDGATALNDWQFPQSKLKNGTEVYYDSVIISREIRLPSDVVQQLDASLFYQVCNEDVCYPAAMLPISCPVGLIK